MKKFRAWAVVDKKNRVVNTDEWHNRPYLIFAKKYKANWWWEENDKVIQVEIREVKSKKSNKNKENKT